MEFPTEELRAWFLQNKRSFPWRENPSPYAVWVSEVMLQQTQAKVVIPYFERWMKRFPTLGSLSQASIDEVIKLWEGLGYYSRARNLHEGAREIVNKFGGKFPEEALGEIKGIGPYTEGAILSFAFHKRAAAIDGNVLRLMARFFAMDDPIDEGKTQKGIREKVLEILPEKRPWEVMEAMIECGATVCSKAPLCEKCPLQFKCRAYREGKTSELPKKRKEQKITHLFRTVGVITCGDEVLLKKGEKGKVMGELYEFPYVETQDLQEGKKLLEETVGFSLEYVKSLPRQEHSFTRFKAFLFPHHFRAEKRVSKNFEWKKDLRALPFSSGHRRILQGWCV